MSKILFTDEQIAGLEKNPFTYKVTHNQIAFTKEFKELFWAEYQKRVSPTEIFRKHNYNPKIIGRSRITGFQQSLKRDVKSGVPFYEGVRPSGMRKQLISNEETVTRDSFKEMCHKVEYLEQEVEFLKKIFSTKNTRK
ncbi:MAG: hypothetical protein PHW47_12355 [Lachnospira sp.]|nr:hypothetical protein [Lachnospira sp.]